MDPEDPRERFTGVAADYGRFRPSYPDALVDWVLARAGVAAGQPVADVGCGTGLLTRQLAARGLDVIGVDPNAAMLAEARAKGGARYTVGEAAATGLPSASIALVTVAQAFHWFPIDPALAEFRRLLRPAGRVAAIYNLRGDGGLMDDYERLLRRFSTRYAVLESWQATLEILAGHPRTTAHERLECDHEQLFDWAGLHGRAWSSSYVFRGVSDPQAFDASLRELFERHSRDGVLRFPYRSVALVFALA